MVGSDHKLVNCIPSFPFKRQEPGMGLKKKKKHYSFLLHHPLNSLFPFSVLLHNLNQDRE